MTFLYLIVAKNSREKRIGNPARIPPQTPPAGGKSAEAKRKILFPQKTDFRFAESVLKPHALPEYLEGRTPKKNVLSIFKKKFTPAKSKKQETFFFGVAGVLASAWDFLRAYASVSLHHALRAWHVSDFGNRFELGTINTQVYPPTKGIQSGLSGYLPAGGRERLVAVEKVPPRRINSSPIPCLP